jgi:hypothetical protein
LAFGFQKPGEREIPAVPPKARSSDTIGTKERRIQPRGNDEKDALGFGLVQGTRSLPLGSKKDESLRQRTFGVKGFAGAGTCAVSGTCGQFTGSGIQFTKRIWVIVDPSSPLELKLPCFVDIDCPY